MFSNLIYFYLFLGLLSYVPLLYIIINSESLSFKINNLVKSENINLTNRQCKLICSVILFFLIPLLPIFIIFRYLANGGK